MNGGKEGATSDRRVTLLRLLPRWVVPGGSEAVRQPVDVAVGLGDLPVDEKEAPGNGIEVRARHRSEGYWDRGLPQLFEHVGRGETTDAMELQRPLDGALAYPAGVVGRRHEAPARGTWAPRRRR